MRLRHLVLLLLAATALRADPEYPAMGPDIYDTQADGMQAVTEAIHQARGDQKHVLLQLGANWCIWCRRLHQTFENNSAIAALLKRKFVLVSVDVNQRNGKNRNTAVNDRYGNPIQHGLPVLVVLDSEGHLLHVQETGALEDGKAGHDPEKIIAFLRRWGPTE